jgi:ornithine cyclodeaminase/alanine dehydrogenase-like protein (mu-crystallin family)
MSGSKVEFLFLSQKDMIAAGVLDMKGCVEVMEKAFRIMNQGDYLMGGPSQNHHGMKLWLPKQARGPRMPVAGPDRRFMAMISYLGGEFNVCGVKWYGSNLENPAKRGLPRSVLMVILNNPETGAPLAVMDGNLISAMRTGAALGLGAKYLAPKGAAVAGVIAAGVIGRTCLMAMAAGVKTLKEVKVFDIDRGKAEAFAKEMSRDLSLKAYAVGSMEEAIKDSDAVCSATSRIQRPTYRGKMFKEDAFLGLSADATLAEDLLADSRIVADNWRMHLDWREEMEKMPEESKDRILYAEVHERIKAGKMKESDIVELKKVVAGEVPARTKDRQKVVYLTGGLNIEDVSWGYTIYQNALKKGLGQKLKMWDEPYWY